MRLCCFVDLRIADKDLENLCLFEIEKILHQNGKSLLHGMPVPAMDDLSHLNGVLLLNKLNCPKEDMLIEHEKYYPLLIKKQLKVYDSVAAAVNHGEGGFYFVHRYRGIGKTFVWKALSAKLRSEGNVVVNAASSGITSLLLPGGRTTHSTFAILMQLNKDSICNKAEYP